MDAFVTSGSGQPNAFARLRPRVAVALLGGVAASGAWALDSEAAGAVAAGLHEPARMQVQLSASSLPRFGNTDGSSRTSRIGIALLPPRRFALGLAVGMTSMDTAGVFYPGSAFTGASSSVDLGLHWRYTVDNNYRIDVTAWRRVTPPDALTLVQTNQPSYGARVEMRIPSAAKTGFVAEKGFIGFQLESGARLTLRRSGAGKPMIYYRTRF